MSKLSSKIWGIIFGCILLSVLISVFTLSWSHSLNGEFDLTGDRPTQDVLELNKGEQYPVPGLQGSNTKALEDFWKWYLESLIDVMVAKAREIFTLHRDELEKRDTLLAIVSWAHPNNFELALITDQDISTAPIALTNDQVNYRYKVQELLPKQSEMQNFLILLTNLIISFKYNNATAIFQDVVFSPAWYANEHLRQPIQPYWYAQERARPFLNLYLQNKTGQGQPETPLIEVMLPLRQRNELGSDYQRVRTRLDDYRFFMSKYIEKLREKNAVRPALCNLGQVKRMVLEITSYRLGNHAYLWATDGTTKCTAISIPPPQFGGPYPPIVP